MKLGAVIMHVDLGNDPKSIRDFVQSIEGAGFDAFHTNDHVIGAHPDRALGEKLHTVDVPVHEPFVLLAYLAAVTTHIELVTSILILPQRQTVLVAKQAAELDLLAGGRLRLGVGVGRNWMEYEALNEQFDNRGERYEEQITVLRRLWTEELVTFDAQWHHLDRIGLNPMPVQRPIPIWIGSFFGKVYEKVIERAARIADGWMPQFPPGDEFAAVLRRFRGYAQAAGRDPADIGIECVAKVAKSDDPKLWVAQARAFEALGATHLKVMTAGGGFASLAEQLHAMLAWRHAVATEVSVGNTTMGDIE